MKKGYNLMMMMVMVLTLVALSGCASWAKIGPEGPEPAIEIGPEASTVSEPQSLKSADGYTYRVLSVTDSLGNKVEMRDEAPGATDVVIRVWVQSENRVYARNLDPSSKIKIGQMVPVPVDWPLGDVRELPVLSGWCSGCLDYLDQYGGQIRISEDTSGYNARVLIGLGYDPPISGIYRPVMNDCSGPSAVSFPEVIEPKARAKIEPIYLTDADAELRGEGVFLFDSTELSPAAKAKLDALLAEAEAGTQFVIETGCDQCGTAAYNDSLSQRRSQSIAKYLQKKGFKVAKIISHGEALAKTVPAPGECEKGFPAGAQDRFLKIYTP